MKRPRYVIYTGRSTPHFTNGMKYEVLRNHRKINCLTLIANMPDYNGVITRLVENSAGDFKPYFQMRKGDWVVCIDDWDLEQMTLTDAWIRRDQKYEILHVHENIVPLRLENRVMILTYYELIFPPSQSLLPPRGYTFQAERFIKCRKPANARGRVDRHIEI